MSPSGSDLRLSVVIPCLDVAETLGAQLLALSEQEVDEPWEVVIADNGSRDGTRELAASFAPRLPALQIVGEPRRGRHHACNSGAEAARAQLLVFIDGDDEVAPGFLLSMLNALRSNPFVGGRLEHRKLNPAWMIGTGEVQTAGPLAEAGFLPFVMGACLGIDRSIFLQVGGFHDMPYCEDIDLSWRLQLAGTAIHFAPEAVTHYRQRDRLTSMYRQHRNFGTGLALLYRHYAAFGMKRRTTRAAAVDWVRILRGLLRARSKNERARLARRLGRAVGRLRGSVRYGVLYP